MLNILERSNEELITLSHGPKVFYDALASTLTGIRASMEKSMLKP